MAAPFEPVYRDGKSGAELVCELAATRGYGDVLTIGEIADHLGIDPAEEPRLRSAVHRAKPRLEREHLKALEAVRGKGYRIINPHEHTMLAGTHRRKSDRQIKRAIHVIEHTDIARLSESDRKRHQEVGLALQLLHQRQRDTEERVGRIEKLLFGRKPPAVVPGEIVAPLAIERGDS